MKGLGVLLLLAYLDSHAGASGWALILGTAAPLYAQAPARTSTAPKKAVEVQEGEFNALLQRLRESNPHEYEKVRQLAEKQPEAALQFLRERFDGKSGKPKKLPPGEKEKTPSPHVESARIERFSRIDTIQMNEFTIDLCRRDDGAFGLGEIRKGKLPLRRADFLITWQAGGRLPVLERREGLTVFLREPRATLTFSPERSEMAGTVLEGFAMEFKSSEGEVVERASWELGGSTKGLSYFDGYRGWHAPPQWMAADSVEETNPKLLPSLLQGTGFQFEHGSHGALLHFHSTPGDRLKNVSRGESLEFVTTFNGASSVKRRVLVLDGDSRINLWTRGFEVAQEEIRQAFDLPERKRELLMQWPDFSRKSFEEVARECAAATAREGFTGVSLYSIWDNADFHGGAKSMNIWDLSVCEGYGGAKSLEFLASECKRQNLRVIFWVPAGHLWGQANLWKEHPDWLLRRADGAIAKTPTGPVFGSLNSGFADYFRERVSAVTRQFGFDGVWMDTHLSYAQQTTPADHAARLLRIYQDLSKAGARHFLVEGDASAFGAYAIGINEEWIQQWGKMPDPDLYYGAELVGGGIDPRLYSRYARQWFGAGTPWCWNGNSSSARSSTVRTGTLRGATSARCCSTTGNTKTG